MARKTKVYGELKKRALLAKQRLRMGYFQQLQEERENVLTSLGGGATNLQRVSELQRAKTNRDTVIAINRAQCEADEIMYERVKSILDEDEDVTNPIGRLMDKEVYDKLDDCGRQRYVLELAKKFRELKERYEKERIGKSG